MLFISIEGNIGSGKSTVIKKLKELFGNEKRIEFLEEPVDAWMHIKDKNGLNMLEKYYADTKNYAFAFQMMAYISRISQIKNILRNTKADIIVSERSVHTDKNVFAKMLFDSELLEDVEYQIYLNWFNEFIKDIPQSIVFYIRTDPNIAYERVQKRARPGETCDIEYLKKCHNYHDSWLIQNCDNVTLYEQDFINSSNFKKVLDNDLAYNKNKLAMLQLDGNINIDQTNNSYSIISNALNVILNTTTNNKEKLVLSNSDNKFNSNCESKTKNIYYKTYFNVDLKPIIYGVTISFITYSTYSFITNLTKL